MPSFYFFESLPSTMETARLKVLEGIEEGAVIVAGEQTKGRGRRERIWNSPKGSLYLTYITYLDCKAAIGAQLSFVACVAVGEALRPFLSPSHLLSYKWPNDVLLNGKKVGGLLLEATALPEKKEMGYLIGCGINVIAQTLEVRYPTTSLQQEGIHTPLQELLHKISFSLQTYVDLWKKRGFSPIHTLWMKDAAGLEKQISFDLQGKTQEGILKGIDREGALLLETSHGIKKFSAGEILAGE